MACQSRRKIVREKKWQKIRKFIVPAVHPRSQKLEKYSPKKKLSAQSSKVTLKRFVNFWHRWRIEELLDDRILPKVLQRRYGCGGAANNEIDDTSRLRQLLDIANSTESRSVWAVLGLRNVGFCHSDKWKHGWLSPVRKQWNVPLEIRFSSRILRGYLHFFVRLVAACYSVGHSQMEWQFRDFRWRVDRSTSCWEEKKYLKKSIKYWFSKRTNFFQFQAFFFPLELKRKKICKDIFWYVEKYLGVFWRNEFFALMKKILCFYLFIAYRIHFIYSREPLGCLSFYVSTDTLSRYTYQ